MRTEDIPTPSTQEIDHHKHLRYASRVARIIGFLFLLSLIPYFESTLSSCADAPKVSFGCMLSTITPWVLIFLLISAYLVVWWLIHDLGRNKHVEIHGNTEQSSLYKMEHALLGYLHIKQDHHHHVHHTHRSVTIAIAGLAAYISFWFFETDTLTNLAVAIVVYILIAELGFRKTHKRIHGKK